MSQSAKITAAIQQYLGENSPNLITLAYQNMDVWNDTTVLPDVKNKLRLTTMLINSIVRPYRNEKDTKADVVEFKPREIGVEVAKADLEFYPEDYRQTYLAQFQKKGVERSPEDLPFAQYIMEGVFAKFGEELNNSTAYFGVRNAAGTTAADVADGFGTKLAAMITATDVTPNVIGALDSTNGLAQMTTLYRSIPEKFRKASLGLTAYMSLSSYEAYQDSLDAKNWNTGRGDDYLGPKYLRGSSGILELKPVSWMAGSDRVIITPMANIITAADATQQDLATSQIVEILGGFDMRIAAAIGFDFAYAGLIWCNDQV